MKRFSKEDPALSRNLRSLRARLREERALIRKASRHETLVKTLSFAKDAQIITRGITARSQRTLSEELQRYLSYLSSSHQGQMRAGKYRLAMQAIFSPTREWAGLSKIGQKHGRRGRGSKEAKAIA